MKRPTPSQPIDQKVQRRLDRLEWLVDQEYGGSVAEFERKTAIKMAQVSQWFTGYRALRDKALARLEEATGKEPGWFDTALPNITIGGAPKRSDDGDLEIPQFDTGGAMGGGLVLPDQPGIIKSWTVSPDWVRLNVHRITSSKNLAIVTGFGPSMQPLFNPGDPLLIDRGITTVDIDGVYFFRVEEHGFVKQLQRIPTENGMILRAKSYNERFDPFDISKNMDFEVFGRVVKVWKGEDF